jgi:hypothetical protein
MDEARFDSLAKVHAAAIGSRRRLVGALAAGLLAATPAALGGDRVAAKNKKRKTKKKKTQSTVPPCGNGECCTPTTCAKQGKTCGALADGCGGTLQCGSCAAPQTCGGGNPGTPGVCGCTKATCAAGECGRRADGCGGTLTCIPATDGNTCWVLAGGDDPFGPAARIRVDDDLTVFVNGQVVARDDDGQAGDIGPFVFPAEPGDTLRIVATDVGAGSRELGALHLWSASSGARNLTDGVSRTSSPQPAGTFFDESFDICLERGQLCRSYRDCCGGSCCGSENDPTDRCRGGCG